MVGLNVKANQKETKILSDAIDKVTDGLDTVIEIYNELESDKPIINFSDEVLGDLTKAKQIYGEKYVDQKINAVVKEMLSWLPLEKVQPNEENQEVEEDAEGKEAD